MDIITITGSFLVSLSIGISATRGLLTWMFPRSRQSRPDPQNASPQSGKPIG